MKSPMFVAASLILNVVLLVCLVRTSTRLPASASIAAPGGPGADVAAAVSSHPDSSDAGRASPSFGLLPATQPFHWNQIESTNFLVYIQNLRSVGCPEQTVRDIVAAELNSLYAGRAGEASAVLGALFPVAGVPAASAVPNPVAQEVKAPERGPAADARQEVGAVGAVPAARLPMAFAPVDPATLGLSPRQQAALEGLQSQFIKEVGGADADPKDPEYQKRWKNAQPRADDKLKAQLGVQAFLRYELESRASRPPAPQAR